MYNNYKSEYTNIHHRLRGDVMNSLAKSINCRFQDYDPFVFEDFIAEMFEKMGYTAYVTQSTGDFGADIIIEKDDIRTAVQVKRYAYNNNVGVEGVNQVIAGTKFYDCDNALCVTTSDYTKAARILARNTGVELWSWHELEDRIKILADTNYKTKNKKESAAKQLRRIRIRQYLYIAFWIIVFIISLILAPRPY